MNFITKLFTRSAAIPGTKTLANSAQKSTDKGKKVLPYTLKAVSIVRSDVKTFNEARADTLTEEPKNFAMQLLLNEISLDGLLTSQIENRTNQIFSIDFKLKNSSGEVDEEQTKLLKTHPAYRKLMHAVLERTYRGYSLMELSFIKKDDGTMVLDADLIPRTNVVPQSGLFYPDYSEDKNINYRELPEFGTWLLEFKTSDCNGLLVKAVPHVIFKRFAQSCWSELCEIYGIPPRVMKTNTQDTAMLARAEAMMRDMGAASWFIIDETETFEWADAASTNGDVYKNLISLCNSELSLLISGAVIGQDTVNGNRSKEESSQNMLWELVKADMQLFEEAFNGTILPALVKLGVLKGDIYGEFEPAPDLESLWKFTQGFINSAYEIDMEWLKTTFGVAITGKAKTQEKEQQQQTKQTFTIGDFFD